jgi:hypothetical protein
MSSADYPLGTVALYGPTDKLATKLVANVYREKAQPAAVVKKWNSQSTDIREDASVHAQLTQFLKEHSVAHAVVTEKVVGCPHEPGIDYPSGGHCPFCPFWSNRPRNTPITAHSASTTIGRNDPCRCGSGKKYKKCCST